MLMPRKTLIWCARSFGILCAQGPEGPLARHIPFLLSDDGSVVDFHVVRNSAMARAIVVEIDATAITITHDMTSVRAIADKIAMLHGGKIRWHGPVSQLDSSGDPYLDQFLHGRAEGPIETLR